MAQVSTGHSTQGVRSHESRHNYILGPGKAKISTRLCVSRKIDNTARVVPRISRRGVSCSSSIHGVTTGLLVSHPKAVRNFSTSNRWQYAMSLPDTSYGSVAHPGGCLRSRLRRELKRMRACRQES
eukprot:3941322-Rhodomonas_salina.3